MQYIIDENNIREFSLYNINALKIKYEDAYIIDNFLNYDVWKINSLQGLENVKKLNNNNENNFNTKNYDESFLKNNKIFILINENEEFLVKINKDEIKIFDKDLNKVKDDEKIKYFQNVYEEERKLRKWILL